jgi:hypothetical protein
MTYLIFQARRRFRTRAAVAMTLAAVFAAGLLITLVGGAAAASSPVPLGTASSFAVLAGAGITNTGPTTVTGDLALALSARSDVFQEFDGGPARSPCMD